MADTHREESVCRGDLRGYREKISQGVSSYFGDDGKGLAAADDLMRHVFAHEICSCRDADPAVYLIPTLYYSCYAEGPVLIVSAKEDREAIQKRLAVYAEQCGLEIRIAEYEDLFFTERGIAFTDPFTFVSEIRRIHSQVRGRVPFYLICGTYARLPAYCANYSWEPYSDEALYTLEYLFIVLQEMGYPDLLYLIDIIRLYNRFIWSLKKGPEIQDGFHELTFDKGILDELLDQMAAAEPCLEELCSSSQDELFYHAKQAIEWYEDFITFFTVHDSFCGKFDEENGHCRLIRAGEKDGENERSRLKGLFSDKYVIRILPSL